MWKKYRPEVVGLRAMATDTSRTSRKWLALVVLCAAQFMVVLDVSIINVALPSIQRSLGFSEQNLLWVLNAYTLVFGGFLMLGGRVADRFGRRRVFLAGVTLFCISSLFCGLATSSGWIVASRAVQGLGAAIASPAALSILTVMFSEGRERNTALSVWGAIAGAGGAFGVLLGGILTQEVGWSWIFYVNVPIGALVVISSLVLLEPARSERVLVNSAHADRARARGPRSDEGNAGFDVPGAIAVTGSLVLLVFALVKSNDWGWSSTRTIGVLVASAVLMAIFLVVESRSRSPLVALPIFKNRSLSVSNVVALILGASIFSMFYFLSLYMQQVLGYSALKTGIGYLSIAAAIIVAASVAEVLVRQFGVRNVLAAGMLLSGGGLVYFSQITVSGSYVGTLLPGFMLAGVGLGLSFVPVTIGAVSGVPARVAGVASGLINTTQQIGGALGVAVLSTLAISATTRFSAANSSVSSTLPHLRQAALTHGFSVAFWYGALLAGVGAVVALTGLTSRSSVVEAGVAVGALASEEV